MSRAELEHERLEELIAADVLDGLDQADHQDLAHLLAAHGPDCQECRRLVADYSEVAGRLAMTLEPAALSATSEERLMLAATARPATPGEGTAASAPGRSRRWLATAAVAAALAVLGGAVGYLLAPRSVTPTHVATFPSAGGPVVQVAFRPGDTHGFILGTNLPAPPGRKVYELWFQPAPGARMVPAGTFVPTGGTVVASVTLGRSFVTLAVSVEPSGGSAQPTSSPILLTKV